MIESSQFPPEFAERYRQSDYWRGELLGNLLRAWARNDPNRIALVDEDRTWTYAELDKNADRVASGLSFLGIQAGDRVVVQLPNVASFAYVAVALFRLGALPVFALPSHRRVEIVYLCKYAEVVAYITVDVFRGFDHRDLARELIREFTRLKHVIVAGDAQEFLSLSDVEAEIRSIPAPRASDIAFFLLSGGSTGLPKLIPRTHDDYTYQLRATSDGLGVNETTVYLAALPVAHNAALGCPGLLGTLRAGGRAVLAASPSPDDAFALIERHGVTLTTLMPPLVHLWLEAAELCEVDFSGLLLQVGSARLAPELARRVQSELGCRLTQWFGMAEGLLTFTRLDDPQEVIDNTVGRPLSPGDEIRVVDEDDSAVPIGAVGELLTRGPYTLRAYYKAPEHNSVAFTQDGFFRTGDIVRITNEGNMIVQGRRKDVINRGGEKIVPCEIEDCLSEHPGLREASVIGVPDEIVGEKICSFIVPRSNYLQLSEIREFLRVRGLADFKLPDRVENIDSIPRTKIGKVDKAKLREIAVQRVRI